MRYHRALCLPVLTSLLCSAIAAGEPSTGKAGSGKGGRPAYLCSFFREPDGNDGLHLATSRDGYQWSEIGPASLISRATNAPR